MRLVLVAYTGTHRERVQLNHYQLSDLTYTASPQQVMQRVKNTASCQMILVKNADQIVGCFCLQGAAGPSEYGGDARSDLLLRSFSIDERERRQHLGLTAMQLVPAYVRQNYPEIKRIILAVNHENVAAKQCYQQAGFRDSGRRHLGRRGEQLIYERHI